MKRVAALFLLAVATFACSENPRRTCLKDADCSAPQVCDLDSLYCRAPTTDAGMRDAGSMVGVDASTDAGLLDAGQLDAGPIDAGSPDSGVDAGAADSWDDSSWDDIRWQ